MTQVNRNACRVCLGVGYKPIFNGSQIESDGIPKGLHFDRLAEKLRFVSMVPVSRTNTCNTPSWLEPFGALFPIATHTQKHCPVDYKSLFD